MEPQLVELPKPNDVYISFLHDGSVTFRRSDSFALDPQGNWVVSFVETGPCTNTTVLTLKPATPVPLHQWMAFARKANPKVAEQVFQQCVAAGYLAVTTPAPSALEEKLECLLDRTEVLRTEQIAMLARVAELERCKQAAEQATAELRAQNVELRRIADPYMVSAPPKPVVGPPVADSPPPIQAVSAPPRRR